MKLLRITDASYKYDYNIEFNFNTDEKGIVDLEQKIQQDHRKIFKPLLDKSFFRNFKLNRWTIEWPNGLDLAPEFLYDLMIQQNTQKENIH